MSDLVIYTTAKFKTEVLEEKFSFMNVSTNSLSSCYYEFTRQEEESFVYKINILSPVFTYLILVLFYSSFMFGMWM